MDPYPCKPLASAQAMVTREISAYCAIKRQKVDEHSPGYLDVDFEKELEAYKEKELEAYKSEDERSCDAVPLGWQTLALRHVGSDWVDSMLADLKPDLQRILEEAYPKDSEL